MRNYRTFIGLWLIVTVSLACGATGGTGGASSGAGNTAGYNTKFPLPANVSNFTASSDKSINFQTALTLKDAIAFYRDAFKQAGLTERTINTAITDTTFSLVFDGDPSGQEVVIQGVDLGNGKTNVNIRYGN
jgi:hypothetical protein